MRKLLEGIRVIEHAVLLNGGMVGSLLGDLGADVIKIEAPGRGDYLRDILGQITPRHSPAHVQVNRQKRSVTLDLTKSEGKEVFWRLHETADAFIDGFLAGASDRLGIGYDVQSTRRPQIVYCQHTGFGASGPYGDIPTHGFMQEALASATPMEQGPDGYPRVPIPSPRRSGPPRRPHRATRRELKPTA
jgi:crotonobetainyl-CoA:carnitine CoA-transferase CaiB-like acyl-CoA transferase